jgi:primosomal protein N' (replication factor Y)
MLIARVAVPRPNVEDTWDYIVPADLQASVKQGVRALIPIGRSKETGYITEVAESPATRKALRPLIEILDDEPLLSPLMLAFTRWAAGYYLTSWGDMIKAALPAGINIKEKEVLRVTPEGREELRKLRRQILLDDRSGHARRLLDHLLESGPRRWGLLQKDFSHRLIGRLLAEGWVEAAKSRGEKKLELRKKAVQIAGEPAEVGDGFWKRSPQRRTTFAELKKLSSPLLLSEIKEKLGVSRAVVDGLVKAGLAEYLEISVRRDPLAGIDVSIEEPHPLTHDQQTVFETLVKALDSRRCAQFLLHGVTGSGKTEIYIHAAKHCLAGGRRVLILIPELALTPQFVRRYYAAFGGDLAVLYSSLKVGERIDEWNRIRKGRAKVFLGTRLSIFAPADDLGLIVVDEEHDTSYKQDDYPTFNARDLAVLRAEMSAGVCLLGSATPSLESLQNVRKGKYTLLRLGRRVHNRPLPLLNIVDMRQPQNRDADSLIAPVVRTGIEETLLRGEQTLILVGRKGYAPFILCRACGFNFQCPNCAVTLSYHEAIKSLKCHYCGRALAMPQICPECGSIAVEAVGYGTEKVEEEINKLFPKARTARMDRDIITNPSAYHDLLGRLRECEIDILVGTQMIAKGHDYPMVTCVAAMGLDSILRLPDFRHAERVFQLIIQISGRAGRGERPGQVYVVTHRPDHYAVRAACENDWSMFLEKELDYRSRLRYPPFGHLALLTIEDFNKGRGRTAAQKLTENLYAGLESRAYILGPSLAPYAKLKNRWRFQMIVKAADRKRLNEILKTVRKQWRGPGRLKINIDPVSVM